jgi:predicted acetyltransferase
VTPTTTIDTSGDDLARLLLATTDWKVTRSDPYMLGLLDVAGALTGRPAPPGLRADLVFGVTGLPVTDRNGTYLLRVADGHSVCVRADSPAERVFAARGLALLYAGVQSCANLRFAGLLSAGDPGEDALWDCLFGGRQMHIRDYF